jgi:hypothetical protein
MGRCRNVLFVAGTLVTAREPDPRICVQLELAEALLTERSDVDGALRSVRRSSRW